MFSTGRINLYTYTARIYIWHLCRRYIRYKHKT